MREHHWWDWDDQFRCNMSIFKDQVGEIDYKEWLQCYDLVVDSMEKDKKACKKKGVTIPKEIHDVARKLKLDANFTNKEEREAGPHHVLMRP